jgi:hypothetical protein
MSEQEFKAILQDAGINVEVLALGNYPIIQDIIRAARERDARLVESARSLEDAVSRIRSTNQGEPT